MMEYLMRAFLQYMKENQGLLLDVMIALGEELEHQPKEKREKFLALLEKQMRKRVCILEKSNCALRKKVILLEEELAVIKKQLFSAKQNFV